MNRQASGGPKQERRNMKRLLGVLLAIGGMFVLTNGIGMALAQGQPDIPTTNAYEGYPLNGGVVPAGCTAQGADILTGETYSVNGGTAFEDMRQINATIGDTVTMNWTGEAPGCSSAIITLSMKATGFKTFVIEDNQYNVLSSSCGTSEGPSCAEIDRTLSLELSPIGGTVSCFQIDSHLGPPLEVVGPEGSYYGSLNGVRNILIGAKNAGTDPCVTQPCAVSGISAPAAAPSCRTASPCSSNPSIASTSDECNPCPTNSAVKADDAGCKEPCATNPAIPADSTSCGEQKPNTAVALPTPAPAEVKSATTIAEARATAPVTLPRTGSNQGAPLAGLGVLLVVSGGLLVGADVLGRRKQRNLL